MWRSANAVISGLVIAAGAVTVLAVLGISLVLAAAAVRATETRADAPAAAADVPLHAAGVPGGGVHRHGQCPRPFLCAGAGRRAPQRRHDRQRAAAGPAHGPRRWSSRSSAWPSACWWPAWRRPSSNCPASPTRATATNGSPPGGTPPSARSCARCCPARSGSPRSRSMCSSPLLLVLVRPDHRVHFQLFGAADGAAARHVRHFARHLYAADALWPGGREEVPGVPADAEPGIGLPGVHQPDGRGHRPCAGGADCAADLRARPIRRGCHPASGAFAGLPGAGIVDVLNEQHPGAGILCAE